VSAGRFSPIKTVAKRELSGYFASPVAFVFIVIFLLLAGFFTFMVAGFFERGEANLTSFFAWHPWLYLFLVPAVGMRMWSEERRLGTIELLLTMPVAPWQAILGKFLASWAVVALALLLTLPVVFTVNYLGNPDNGVIFAGRRAVVVSDSGGLSAGYESARAMGESLARGWDCCLQRDDPFRKHSEGRHRFTRRHLFPVGDCLLALHHGSDPPRASRRLSSVTYSFSSP
jgi:hypothetical protein